MAYTRICVAAALQRYIDITPIAARLRDLAGVLALADNAPLTVVTPLDGSPVTPVMLHVADVAGLMASLASTGRAFATLSSWTV